MSKYDTKEILSKKINDITRILNSLEYLPPLYFKVTACNEKLNEDNFTFRLEGNMCQSIKNEIIKSLELRLKELETSYFMSKENDE